MHQLLTKLVKSNQIILHLLILDYVVIDVVFIRTFLMWSVVFITLQMRWFILYMFFIIPFVWFCYKLTRDLVFWRIRISWRIRHVHTSTQSQLMRWSWCWHLFRVNNKIHFPESNRVLSIRFNLFFTYSHISWTKLQIWCNFPSWITIIECGESFIIQRGNNRISWLLARTILKMTELLQLNLSKLLVTSFISCVGVHDTGPS